MKKNNENKTDKKLGLKLNKKEKTLLGTVAVGLVAFGCYNVLNGLITKNGELVEEYDRLQLEFNEKSAKIARKGALVQELKKLNSDTNKVASNYYGNTNQGEFIYLIDHLISKSGITLQRVEFAETKELEFPEKTDKDAAAQGKDQKVTKTETTSSTTSASSTGTSTSTSTSTSSSSSSETQKSSESATQAGNEAENKYANTNITQMTADIDFSGTYSQVLELLKMIDANERTIVSSELDLGSPKAKQEVDRVDPLIEKGHIKLRFYQVEDVERYVSKPASNVDKTPIPFAHVVSPFKRASWLSISEDGGKKSASKSSSTTSNSSSDVGSGLGSAPGPAYLQQLANSTNNTGGISAYYNTSTLYRFETNLKLKNKANDAETDVTVDTGDFLEGAGSNVVQIPASKEKVIYEMRLQDPFITLNEKPDYILFDFHSSKKWDGSLGMIVENANGQEIQVGLLEGLQWEGWREARFDPTSVASLSYPLKVKGFYFETPNTNSDGTTLKLDNFAIQSLISN
ncbi:hypothetical protein K6V78_02915 [Streptococcus gallolyticus]|nr:hypothetical protein [Streptococcus gallolyticus]MBY5040592.1 hypothetical protein [Streptococcus gallolyticus]